MRHGRSTWENQSCTFPAMMAFSGNGKYRHLNLTLNTTSSKCYILFDKQFSYGSISQNKNKTTNKKAEKFTTSEQTDANRDFVCIKKCPVHLRSNYLGL